MIFIPEGLQKFLFRAQKLKAQKGLPRMSKALKRVITIFMPNLDWAMVSKDEGVIVIVHFDSLGDAILFSPVIRSAALTFHDSQIALITLSERKVLYENCPFIHHFYGLTPQKWMSPKIRHYFLIYGTYLLLLFRFPGRIRRVIGPTWLLFDNWKEFRQDILHNKLRQGSRKTLTIDKLPLYKSVDRQHQVKRMLSLAEIYGVQEHGTHLEVWLREDSNFHFKNSASFAVLLGSSHPRRSWPTERYITVIKEIIEEFPHTAVSVFGQSKFIPNYHLLKELDSLPNVENYVDKTDLVSLRSKLNQISFVVGNDTGTMHLAAALGIPCIVISSHSKSAKAWNLHSPNRYHPWNTPYEVIQPEVSPASCLDTCSSENAHCILSVSPFVVGLSARKYLQRG